jgi:hypothetical protein
MIRRHGADPLMMIVIINCFLFDHRINLRVMFVMSNPVARASLNQVTLRGIDDITV